MKWIKLVKTVEVKEHSIVSHSRVMILVRPVKVLEKTITPSSSTGLLNNIMLILLALFLLIVFLLDV